MTMAKPRTRTTTAHLVAAHPPPKCYRPSNSRTTWPQERVSVKRHIQDHLRHHCLGHSHWPLRSVARNQPARNSAHARASHRERTPPRHPAPPTSMDGWRNIPNTARITATTTGYQPNNTLTTGPGNQPGAATARTLAPDSIDDCWKSRPPSAPAFQQPRQRRHRDGW